MNSKMLGVLLLVGVVVGSLTLSGQSQKKPLSQRDIISNHRELPVVDFSLKPQETVDLTSQTNKEEAARRKTRAARYDRHSSEPIQEGYLISGRVWSTHWYRGLSALPVTESDAILLGGVIDAKAHLSNDKTGIYSEFSVQVEEVLKNSGPDSIIPGTVVSIERFGGAVRFPSGTIQRYETTGQGMPRVGERYLFFLKRRNEGDLTIVTGYQLQADVVSPLDGSAVEGGKGVYPFDIYQGFDTSRFLQIVRSETAQKPNSTF